MDFSWVARRTRATTSCEVRAGGLLRMRRPLRGMVLGDFSVGCRRRNGIHVSEARHGAPGRSVSTGYDGRMIRTAGATIRLIAWLVCVVMAWMSLSSPQCERCDGPRVSVVSSSSHRVAHPSSPVERDECNGVCTCCGFHWVPESEPMLSSIGRADAAPAAEIAAVAFTPRLPYFRPPRMAVSS